MPTAPVRSHRLAVAQNRDIQDRTFRFAVRVLKLPRALQRGTAEQWIREGKYAVKWTRLSCHDFKDNQVRLQLFALAYNLGNFLRRLALPRSVKHWSLTKLREKLIKIGAKVMTHSRYVIFQMAEVAVPRDLFARILERIQWFGVPPPVVRPA